MDQLQHCMTEQAQAAALVSGPPENEQGPGRSRNWERWLWLMDQLAEECAIRRGL